MQDVVMHFDVAHLHAATAFIAGWIIVLQHAPPSFHRRVSFLEGLLQRYTIHLRSRLCIPTAFDNVPHQHLASSNSARDHHGLRPRVGLQRHFWLRRAFGDVALAAPVGLDLECCRGGNPNRLRKTRGCCRRIGNGSSSVSPRLPDRIWGVSPTAIKCRPACTHPSPHAWRRNLGIYR